MSCDICGRGSCSEWMHSMAERERYEKVIEAFDKARELRRKVLEEVEEEEREQEDYEEDQDSES